jgi:hypothetical protein
MLLTLFHQMEEAIDLANTTAAGYTPAQVVVIS